jgi:hypothetical protein
MQETRRLKPSTVSRRFSVTAGLYRTCVIDGVLEHSPAEHVRRPAVPAESPTLGFTHLQFEALLTAARESPNRCDFALAAILGVVSWLLALIAETTGSAEQPEERIAHDSPVVEYAGSLSPALSLRCSAGRTWRTSARAMAVVGVIAVRRPL